MTNLLVTSPAEAGTLDTTAHLLAGNARFTILHPQSQTRYTYHVVRPNSGKDKGRTFARLLTGPQNTADYTEIGEVNPETGVITLTGRIGKRESGCPESLALIRWVLALAVKKAPVPEGLELHHAGFCLRCGRTLTVPFPDNPFRPFGLGPECGAK